MRYRPLKSLTVSEIGYGTWPLSGNTKGSLAYGATDDAESKMALERAFDLGVTLYDVADFYGFGHVETLLGEVFAQRRDRIVLATKVGMVSVDGQQDFSAGHMARSLEQSLRRLKTDYVDVYMLHSPKLSILDDGEVVASLRRFQQEGKVREIGISLASPADGPEAIKKYGFEIIEVNYNILDQRAEAELFPLCLQARVFPIIRTPLAQGILSGNFQFSTDPSDRRNAWSKERVAAWTEAYQAMMAHIEAPHYTPAQNALRFCLANPAVATVIPGMKTRAEIAQNLLPEDYQPLSRREIENIAGTYRARGL